MRLKPEFNATERFLCNNSSLINNKPFTAFTVNI